MDMVVTLIQLPRSSLYRLVSGGIQRLRLKHNESNAAERARGLPFNPINECAFGFSHPSASHYRPQTRGVSGMSMYNCLTQQASMLGR